MAKKCKTCGKINKYPMNKYCSFECTPDDHFSKRKYQTKIKQTEPKKIGKKRAERLANGGSEVNTFKKHWMASDCCCWVCNRKVLEPGAFCFAHIFAKGQEPALRLLPSNIAFVCSIDHHSEIDKIINKIKKDGGRQELMDLILAGDIEKVKEFVKAKI